MQSGRFETNTKICLSISSHHPEQWQPSWSMRTALTALIAFLPTPGDGALGSLSTPASVRHRLAMQSRFAPFCSRLTHYHGCLCRVQECSSDCSKYARCRDAGFCSVHTGVWATASSIPCLPVGSVSVETCRVSAVTKAARYC